MVVDQVAALLGVPQEKMLRVYIADSWLTIYAQGEDVYYEWEDTKQRIKSIYPLSVHKTHTNGFFYREAQKAGWW